MALTTPSSTGPIETLRLYLEEFNPLDYLTSSRLGLNTYMFFHITLFLLVTCSSLHTATRVDNQQTTPHTHIHTAHDMLILTINNRPAL
jgi:hypothetical protein